MSFRNHIVTATKVVNWGTRRAHHHQFCKGFKNDCAAEGLSTPVGDDGICRCIMENIAKMGFMVSLQLLAGGVCA